MPATYEPIATTTLGSAASTITFSSIPSTYTDLRLVFVGKPDITNSNLLVRFNNDGASTGLYSKTDLVGDGSTVSSSRATNANHWALGTMSSSTIDNFYELDIFSYANSTFKTALSTLSSDRNGAGNVSRFVWLYRSTTAISRMDLISSANQFATGTTATIYGILKA